MYDFSQTIRVSPVYSSHLQPDHPIILINKKNFFPRISSDYWEKKNTQHGIIPHNLASSDLQKPLNHHSDPPSPRTSGTNGWIGKLMAGFFDFLIKGAMTHVGQRLDVSSLASFKCSESRCVFFFSRICTCSLENNLEFLEAMSHNFAMETAAMSNAFECKLTR